MKVEGIGTVVSSAFRVDVAFGILGLTTKWRHGCTRTRSSNDAVSKGRRNLREPMTLFRVASGVSDASRNRLIVRGDAVTSAP